MLSVSATEGDHVCGRMAPALYRLGRGTSAFERRHPSHSSLVKARWWPRPGVSKVRLLRACPRLRHCPPRAWRQTSWFPALLLSSQLGPRPRSTSRPVLPPCRVGLQAHCHEGPPPKVATVRQCPPLVAAPLVLSHAGTRHASFSLSSAGHRGPLRVGAEKASRNPHLIHSCSACTDSVQTMLLVSKIGIHAPVNLVIPTVQRTAADTLSQCPVVWPPGAGWLVSSQGWPETPRSIFPAPDP